MGGGDLTLDLANVEHGLLANVNAGLELGTQAILSLVVVRSIAQTIAELKVGAKTTCIAYPFVNVPVENDFIPDVLVYQCSVIDHHREVNEVVLNEFAEP